MLESTNHAILETRLVLNTLQPILSGEITQIEPLQGGTTNTVYKFLCRGKYCCAKFFTEQSTALGINRENELSAVRTAAELKIGPILHYATSKVIVTDFEDTDIPENAIDPLIQGKRLLALIKVFHAISPSLSTFDTLELISSMTSEACKNNAEPPPGFSRLYADALRLREAFPIHTYVPSHNDLNLTNMLIGKGSRLLIIDWEYAGNNSQFYDAAKYANHHELNAQQGVELVSSMYPISGEEAHLFNIERALAATWSVAWLLLRGCEMKNLRKYIPMRFAQARLLMDRAYGH